MMPKSASVVQFSHAARNVQTSCIWYVCFSCSSAGGGRGNIDGSNHESDDIRRRRPLVSSSCGVSSVIVFDVSRTLFVFCGQSALPSCVLSSVPLRSASGGKGGGAKTSRPRRDCATASLSILLLSCTCLAIDDRVFACLASHCPVHLPCETPQMKQGVVRVPRVETGYSRCPLSL